MKYDSAEDEAGVDPDPVRVPPNATGGGGVTDAWLSCARAPAAMAIPQATGDTR